MPDMETGGNPDARQDTDLILSVMQENLGPLFEILGSRIKDLEEDLGETKDLLFKLAEGLIGAADGHKKTQLSDMISSKYGADIEPLDGFYKDVHGKGFADSLIEELMGDNAPDEAGMDEWIKNKLGDAKGKYGKYIGIKTEVEPDKEAVAEAVEPAAVEPAAEAAESEEKQAEEEAPEEPAKGAADGIFEQFTSLGGQKRKLSGPIMPTEKK